MNNIDQMIEVLEAYKRGEKIEYYNLYSQKESWKETRSGIFNFAICEYRIAKPEPKKIKLQAWLMPSGALAWYDMRKVQTWSNDAIRIPEEDKEITLP